MEAIIAIMMSMGIITSPSEVQTADVDINSTTQMVEIIFVDNENKEKKIVISSDEIDL